VTQRAAAAASNDIETDDDDDEDDDWISCDSQSTNLNNPLVAFAQWLK